MRSKTASRILTAATAFGLAVATSFAASADVIVLQLPNIPGDAKFAANNGLPADSIRVLTIGSGVDTGCVVGSSFCTSKPIFSKISVAKKFGESSPALFRAVATGTFMPMATISFYRIKQGSPPVKYYTIRLRNAVVYSQTWTGNSNAVDSPDTEGIELGYDVIELIDADTGAHACFNVKASLEC